MYVSKLTNKQQHREELIPIELLNPFPRVNEKLNC